MKMKIKELTIKLEICFNKEQMDLILKAIKETERKADEQ